MCALVISVRTCVTALTLSAFFIGTVFVTLEMKFPTSLQALTSVPRRNVTGMGFSEWLPLPKAMPYWSNISYAGFSFEILQLLLASLSLAAINVIDCATDLTACVDFWNRLRFYGVEVYNKYESTEKYSFKRSKCSKQWSSRRSMRI